MLQCDLTKPGGGATISGGMLERATYPPLVINEWSPNRHSYNNVRILHRTITWMGTHRVTEIRQFLSYIKTNIYNYSTSK